MINSLLEGETSHVVTLDELLHLRATKHPQLSEKRRIYLPGNYKPTSDWEQVTDVSELKIGGLYFSIHIRDWERLELGEVFCLLAINKPEEGWITVRSNKLGGWNRRPYERSLADLGVIPYAGGKWNIENFLVSCEINKHF